MNEKKLLSKKGFIYTILIIGVLTLTLVNFWGWFYMKGVEDAMLQELTRNSKRTAQVYANSLSEQYGLQEAISPDDAEVHFLTLINLLYTYKETSDLEYLFLTSLDRQRFFDPEFDANRKERVRNYPINDSLFQQVIFQDTTVAERVTFAGEYFMTTYAPVFNLADIPIAVLVMEAKADVFSTLQTFRDTLFYMGLGGILVIAIFAAIIVNAVRQLLQTEEKLLQQSRLAQLGQMAAMVAHEIRNPLSIIKGSADVLRKKYASEDNELFDFIPEEINRLNRLVSDFLQFARRKELPLADVNAVEIISGLTNSMNDPRIETALAEDSPELQLDSDAFKQVMLNIIENARKSTPEAESRERASIFVRSSILDRPRKYRIEVEDHGEGMTPEVLSQIFDPFFSTRATGSGLGMAITKQLVEQMKGNISVTSQKNAGTTVRLEFPIS